jgi:hypothetical protein
LGLALFVSAEAQEIPRPSLSRRKESAPSLTRPYNLKIGPAAFTASAGLGLEFVDNLNLTSEDSSGDFIIRPAVSVAAVWQVTKLNSLDLSTTLGYTKYLDHPDLDSQSALISPDSAIRLNLFVGDVKIIFHERFSLQEDPITDGSVSGVAKLGRFTNTIGVALLWDLNDVIWSIGYDHLNYVTTGNTGTTNRSTNSNFSLLDHSTDQVSTSAMVKLGPTTDLGLEATAGYSRYPKNPENDATTFTLGPVLDIQLTRYTHLTLGGGYTLYSTESGEGGASPDMVSTQEFTGIGGATVAPRSNPRGGDGDGYYLNLALQHRLNRSYQDQLAIGREFQIGLLSERTETTFINYSSSWYLSQRFSLASALFYENVRQTTRTALSDFRRYGAVFSTSYLLTRKMNVGISYQFTRKTADVASQDYTQNRLSLQFGYQF